MSVISFRHFHRNSIKTFRQQIWAFLNLTTRFLPSLHIMVAFMNLTYEIISLVSFQAFHQFFPLGELGWSSKGPGFFGEGTFVHWVLLLGVGCSATGRRPSSSSACCLTSSSLSTFTSSSVSRNSSASFNDSPLFSFLPFNISNSRVLEMLNFFNIFFRLSTFPSFHILR